ncbi:MAG: hypothetical protein OEM94_10165 [Acidimicrobiia bacterium]|nr:hypothetical protein [Acidimicrobiia bacterium]
MRDLLSRAETAANGGTVTVLRLRVGALAGADPSHLREHIDREATSRWGHSPVVEIEASEDATHPDALGVVLVSVEL